MGGEIEKLLKEKSRTLTELAQATGMSKREVFEALKRVKAEQVLNRDKRHPIKYTTFEASE